MAYISKETLKVFCLTVTKDIAGKTMQEILDTVTKTDSFLKEHGSIYTETSGIVTLDDEIIVFTAFENTVVSEGQTIRVFSIGHGG